MALTQQEQNIARLALSEGKNSVEVMKSLSAFRRENKPKGGFVATIKDIPSDIGEAFSGSVESVSQGIEKTNEVRDNVTAGETTPLSGTFQTIGAGLKAGAGVVGEGILGLGKLFTSPAREEKIAGGVADIAQNVVETDPVQSLITKYNALEPEKQRNVDATLGITEGLATMFGLRPAVSALETGIKTSKEGIKGAFQSLRALEVPEVGSPTSLFKSSPKTLEEIGEQLDNSVNVNTGITKQIDTLIQQGKATEARALAESTASPVSLKEKLIGLRPDVKKRIEGKEDLMREYFDITHARNVNDTLPTVQEYAADFARKAADDMANKLSETGGDIGAIRTKLGTIKAPIENIQTATNSFIDEIGKLNLVLKNGKIIQKPGTPTKLQGTSDLRILNEMYSQMLILKQSPTLRNVIDIRTNFDGKINFGKSQREISNSVDALARRVRSDLAETANTIVGKTGADDVKKYSEFMDAFNDIKSYTDRKAGGEYLLRQVLSGRGGESRKIIATIEEHTGIDLLDHATMMQIALDVLGNDAQKNLFRQEITKAGLDAAKILTGDVSGAAAVLFKRVSDKVLDQERIFLEAAAKKPSDAMMRKLTAERGAVGKPTNEFMASQINKELNKVHKKLAPLMDKLENGTATPKDIDRIKSLEAEIDSLIPSLKFYGGKPSKTNGAKTPATTNLIEEAKKYDSADDFVKAQGETYYHGSPKQFSTFDKAMLGGNTMADDASIGFHFTKNKDVAGIFGKTQEVQLSIKKPFRIWDFIGDETKYKELYALMDGKNRGIDYDDFTGVMDDALSWNNQEFKNELLETKVIANIKNNGYDAIILPDTNSDILGAGTAGVKNVAGEEVIPLSLDQIKTRTQLEQIWKQANQ